MNPEQGKATSPLLETTRKMTRWMTWTDLLKLFFPLGWGIFALIGVFGYLLMPDTPRWIAASAWLISTIISLGFVVHIWNYHRFSKPSNYNLLPEPNQKRVSVKLIIAVLVCITTFIVSIVFWASKKPEEYADASAYTMSWIISAIWLWDLWKYHRDSKGQASFDRDKTIPHGQKTQMEATNSHSIDVEMNVKDVDETK